MAGKLSDQFLIVAWGDVDVCAGERDALLALATLAARFGLAGFCGRRDFAMANGDFPLMQVFDAERIPESPGEFFKLENFAGIRLLVDAVEGVKAAFEKVMCHGAVGGEHELFNDAMGDVALAAADINHVLLRVEFDDGLGKIEIDRAIFVAAGVEELSETFHGAEMVVHVSVTLAHFRIAVEHLVDVAVGHALGRTDHAGNHDGSEGASGGIKMHDGAHDEALFARIERAHAIRKSFGKHGNGAIDEINGIAAEAGFAIERGFGSDVVGYVGNVNLQEPAAIVATFDVDGIVEIARRFTVDGDDGEFAKIFSGFAVGVTDRASQALAFLKNFGGKGVGQVMLADDDFGIHTEIAGTAHDFNDATGWCSATTAIMQKLSIDYGAVELGNMWQTFAAVGLFFFGQLKLLAESGGEFFAGN